MILRHRICNSNPERQYGCPGPVTCNGQYFFLETEYLTGVTHEPAPHVRQLRATPYAMKKPRIQGCFQFSKLRTDRLWRHMQVDVRLGDIT